MIDEIERQLILELQQNGRASHVELAKKLGIHVSTVAKMIRLLEEKDLIKIRALPNPFKLGYSAHAFITIKAEKENIDSICSLLYANFNVNLIVTAFGKFDILALVYFSSWDGLLNFIATNLSAANGVLNVETFLVKDIRKRYYGQFMDDSAPVKIDEVDQRIIEQLPENGRCPSKQLAKHLKISLPTCLRRLNLLLAEKVIEIKAVPDPSKIGVTTNAFMLLHVKVTKIEDICAELEKYKDIFLIMTLYNGYHILVGISAPDPGHLHQLIKKSILTIDGIIDDETIIRAEVKKRYYGKFLE